jgi:hypothetical protein
VEDKPNNLNKLTKYIRPVITLVWTLIMLYCIFIGKPIGEWEKALYTSILGFYFGERSALKKPGESQ